MSHQYFSKDFAKQFRNECELYSPTPEYQHGKLLVKQFSANDPEMPLLGERLTDKLFNTQIISQIILRLRNRDTPAAHHLFNTATTFKNECETYLELEPYTARYYNDLIAMFDSFSALMNAFKKDFEEQVCSQLTTYYTDIHRSGEPLVAENYSLVPVIELTDFYLKNMLAYYNYFVVTWQYEANNSKGIAVTTHMADYLQALTINTEETIAGIEETRSLLLTWEAEMEIKEEQELYN